MKTMIMTFALCAVFIASARGQGFQNLDFESANNLPVNVGYGTLVSATNAIPGWSAYDGTLALSDIFYASNIVSGTAASVGLDGGNLALSGSFSAALYLNSSISQTGLVPSDAESLQFEAENPGPPGSIEGSDLSVTLGGQKLSYSLFSEGSSYSVYGANIPADLDGQVEALIFACQGAGSGNLLLDNIEFSTSSVPEPGEWSLIGIGVMVFGFCRRRRRV